MLAFRTSSCHFRERKLKKPSGVEILRAVGNVGEIKRKVAVIVLYIPPDTSASRMEIIREMVGTEIAAVKTGFANPIILVCGDINGRNLEAAFDVDNKIQAIGTGPTRGENTLDVVFSNIDEYVRRVDVLPPLETESGNVSDHKVVEISVTLPQREKVHLHQKNHKKTLGRSRREVRPGASRDTVGIGAWCGAGLSGTRIHRKDRPDD